MQTPCYIGSKIGASCEAVSTEAAVDQARDADRQATALWWQFGVSAVTMLAAFGAAFFAERAAHHTKRSADAAEASATDTIKALAVAEQSANAAQRLAETSAANATKELRAYFDFDEIHYLRRPDKDEQGLIAVLCVMRIKNYGRTPGNDGKLETIFHLIMDVDDSYPFTTLTTTHFTMIAPNDHFTYNCFLLIPDELWDAILTRKYRLQLKTFVEYKDTFSQERTLKSDFINEGLDEPFSFVEGSRSAD